MWQPARPACNARSHWHHMVHESVGGEQTRGASCTCTASQKHRAPTCAPNDAYLLPRLYPEGDALEDGVQVRPVSHLHTHVRCYCAGFDAAWPGRDTLPLGLSRSAPPCSAPAGTPVAELEERAGVSAARPSPVILHSTTNSQLRNSSGKISGSRHLQKSLCQAICDEFQQVQDITSRDIYNAGCARHQTAGAMPTSRPHMRGSLF